MPSPPPTRTAPFRDRAEAGKVLGEALAFLAGAHPVVLALPRGGVPVAAEVAACLDAPLDVIVVRTLRLPSQPERGFGAIGEGGVRLFDADLVQRARMSQAEVDLVETREREELGRRLRRYRAVQPPLALEGRTVVIVDDGLATGATAMAAVQVARAKGARHIVLAVPVAPPATVRQLQPLVDRLVCPVVADKFAAEASWYEESGPTSDREVAELLVRHRRPGRPAAPAVDRQVVVDAEGALLPGRLEVPAGATGLVLFAHGSGNSPHGPHSQVFASALHAAGLGTLLFDLLTEEEGAQRWNVFNVDLLGSRLVAASEWVHRQPEVSGLPYGYLGASTGGGAALWAAGAPGGHASVVVSRGGGPTSPGIVSPTWSARPCSSSLVATPGSSP